MTFNEIDQRLQQARLPNGSYDGLVIAELYKQGIRFEFLTTGVRWKIINREAE